MIILGILSIIGAAVTAYLYSTGYFKRPVVEDPLLISPEPNPQAVNPAPVPSLPPNPPPMPPVTKTNREKLYDTAKASLGRDMSPLDIAPDRLACMESLDGVYFSAFGEHLLSQENRLSTEKGYQAMVQDKRLQKVSTPLPGDIVIDPTGYSKKGSLHGHTGIWGNYDVMSNDSNTGLWTDNYTHDAWHNVFEKTLGFPTFYFRVLE